MAAGAVMFKTTPVRLKVILFEARSRLCRSSRYVGIVSGRQMMALDSSGDNAAFL